MAWIESHQELARHHKTMRLARALGVGLPQAVGHLHFLWWWALDFAQDGDLSRYTAEDLASVSGWEGDAETFLAALLNAGFVDETDNGYMLHDWMDYAGRLVEKRKADAERKRKSRGARADVRSISNGRPADIRRTSSGECTESTRNPNLNQEEEEEDRAHTRAHTREADWPPEVLQPSSAPINWIRWYEEQTTQLPSRKEMRDGAALIERGVTEELIIEAIKHAIDRKADRPVSYALKVLGDLQPYNVRTVEDWQKHQAEREQVSTQRRARSPTREAREVHPIDEFDWSGFDPGDEGG